MEKWFIKNKKADYKAISNSYGVSELLAKLIVNRNIKSGQELEMYINPSIDKMHNPYLMKDIKLAVDILEDKIKNNKHIRIVGDYDVDGVISTYLLYTAFKECNAFVDYEIPDRVKDGYGINKNIIQQAFDDGVDVIITCDNGISAIEQIQYAKELNMTVIVTDHHDIPFEEENDTKKYIVPNADAVINPKQADCEYQYKNLCGAAVCYKLIEVLYKAFNIDHKKTLDLIEYVAIATICDVVDLMDENRIIVKNGLIALNNTTNLGLRALIKETKMEGKILTVYHIGFIIGPCINASGRLDTAKKGLRLLLSDTREQAEILSKELKNLNDERKELTLNGFNLAVDLVESTGIIEDKVFVIYLEDCHESLAGIIAGRIREKYNKPTIILTKAEDGVKGSARSIEEYNIFEELIKCKELLNKFGGHPMAAGLSLDKSNIEPLRRKLNQITMLTNEDLYKKVSIDSMLGLEDISINLIEDIRKLEPYGKANEKPLFALKEVYILKAVLLGANSNVLKLTLKTKFSKTITGMYFGNIEYFEDHIINKYSKTALLDIYNGSENNVLLDIVFYPDINEYNGYKNIQIIIQHIRC